MFYGCREVGNDNGMFFKFYDLIFDWFKSYLSNLIVFVFILLKLVFVVLICVFKVEVLLFFLIFFFDVVFIGKFVCFVCV